MKTRFGIAVLVVALFVAVPASFAVNIDGEVSPVEYAYQTEFDKGNYKLYWQFDGDRVHMGIVAKTPGWISVGFDPGSFMAKSDMILVAVKDSTDIKVYDEWCSGAFGPHKPDTEQGGTSDILAYAGSRNGDWVTFEFTRLLDTKDKYDKVIPTTGKFKIMWAYGSGLDITAKHKKAGTVSVQMDGKK
ncbi:MAG TPA: DOMON domain-containing protein [Spirochaetales bacterium]|nr:DOMON domain-containing protein [Spirochaetales bacterium]